ncbi:MAG: hypothetical protein KA791_11020 [Flavobacteriales bacterium]|nr:hypothetical protein [Flavobacteriales bacterium]
MPPIRSVFIALTFVTSWGSFGQSAATVASEEKGVYENDFIRSILYTWTTKEQIDDLARNKVLLTKSRSETKGYSIFDISLRDSALQDNPLARMLQDEQFAKKRFAWTNSWATIMGWKGETYGHHLIRIVLSDSALVGMFDLTQPDEPLAFFDMQGRKLTTDAVLLNRHRIGVVYHVNDYTGNRTEWIKTGTYHGLGKWENQLARVPFREYVIVNEGMIKDWGYGTSETENRMLADLEMLEHFKRSRHMGQKAYRNGWGGWWDHLADEPGDRPEADSQTAFESYTCFMNDYYLFNRKRIKKVIAELRAARAERTGEIRK